ncbi:septum formation initiator family protein [Vagococcus xieshaowenii]|uniref:Cell division protein FtsL n=1 Tax=Vagococcus xieshaowenii TaxID=2562451 RepID=A0AAJ5JMT4_9ENTE|nr:septum formation initiator family protein [Vagococcus xieshaowenii]QCA28993.1 cell division protein FtsL [Vagococcus xieshaowenii]TFZ43174.1 cell division protein FtsL [Vagococcus xieshaowenii]
MAEQRSFDVIEQAVNEPVELSVIETSTENVDFSQPISRLERITKIEKLLVATLIVFFVILSALTVQISNRVSQYENEISSIESKNSGIKQSVTELEQEKTELSRVDKLNEIAKQAGLTKHEDNIRNVTD